MKQFFLMATTVFALAACNAPTQDTDAAAPPTSGDPVPMDRLPALLDAAVASCLGLIQGDGFDQARMTDAGFRPVGIVGGTGYRARLGTRTLDRLNSVSLQVAPTRKGGCNFAFSGLGRLEANAGEIISRLTAQGWTYTPQVRRRAWTKDGVTVSLIGSSFQSLTTLGLQRA